MGAKVITILPKLLLLFDVCSRGSTTLFVSYFPPLYRPLIQYRIKKGSRVYAMYPQTTSLYSATVIDSTTYCRDDDDIIVVEFDGEEPGTFGSWDVTLGSYVCTCILLRDSNFGFSF